MGARGRKSSDVVKLLYEPVTAVQRPEPLPELTDEEGEEWVGIVNSMPAHHFIRANYPILAQYCRHTCYSRILAKLIDHDKELLSLAMAAKDYKTASGLKKSMMALMRQNNSESAAMNILARSMRLTQRSVKDENMKHIKTPDVKPWERKVVSK